MTIRNAKLTFVAALAGAAAVFATAVTTSSSRAEDKAVSAPTSKPSIVLVHGAFADGSGWNLVIPLLQRAGYEVTAVQNPLSSSLPDDIAKTKRVVDAQPGSVVLVGHSYGGAVITGAAAKNSKVKALVYVAAFAPESGEPVGAFGEKYPAPLGTALLPDAAGFLYVDRGKFHDVFAKDLPPPMTKVMAATQKPVSGSVFGASVPYAAWKDIPSWYVVAQQDHAINPDLERFYAQRAKATTVELKTSHVPFLSQPQAIAKVILDAAKAKAPSESGGLSATPK